MKTLEQKIKIMQAALDGKNIEKYTDGMGWQEVASLTPIFAWGTYDYRIKPEPMEFWVNVYPDVNVLHKTKADAVIGMYNKPGKTIKVCEVLDE